ncbi:hypothetical protein REPUB_Repub08aG0214400 [Reevesia pubescens]
MEKKICYPDPISNALDFTMRKRDRPPAHYTFKVESFSMISKIFSDTQMANYKSSTFESGGYKWRLCFYPTGRKIIVNKNEYLSLYLEIVETESLPLGWEVNVIFRLFVLDQIRDKYLTLEDANGGIRCLNAMKTELGFAEFLSLDAFNEASNGYLLEDSCVFGAEVFVVNSTGNGECLSILKNPIQNIYTWKIASFSTLTKECLTREFTVGEHQWSLEVIPKGVGKDDGKSYIQLGLRIDDWETNSSKDKLYAKYTLRIRDQKNGKHEAITDYDWFSSSTSSHCYFKFMSLDDLYLSSNGFLVKDTITVEAEIEILSVVKIFSQKD